jgi:hypothetical protein
VGQIQACVPCRPCRIGDWRELIICVPIAVESRPLAQAGKPITEIQPGCPITGVYRRRRGSSFRY